jgi:hypothetical protein
MTLKEDPLADRAGLCASCRFADVITSSRGSTFHLCALSATDPSFRRYPVLPVLACRGYERRADESDRR